MSADFFTGFRAQRFVTGEADIHAVVGGSGPPLLLLHGWPQSHVIWHRLAPLLAKRFMVVAADLRGYGQSSKPADGDNHAGYSKRAMAKDQVEVMQQLGFERFAVVGHDRGGRVAHRMALDFADRISAAMFLDIVPTLTLYSNVTKAFASAYFHWFFLIQPAPLPETLLQGKGEFFLRSLFRGLDKSIMSEEAFAEYVRHFNDSATLHAMCEDYRAAASIDLDHDRTDLTRKIACPLRVLWGERGAMHSQFDVLSTWRERADRVTGKALPSGHWMPEEIPDMLYDEIVQFVNH